MKNTTKIISICSVSIALGFASILTFADEESLYMENVGSIKTYNPHMLGGSVEVSGVRSPTNLYLDLVLPDGVLFNIGKIPVTKDGSYQVAEIIDPLVVPSGNVILNISSSNGLAEKNLSVDLSVSEIPEESEASDSPSPSNGFIAKVGNASAGTMSLSRIAANNIASLASLGYSWTSWTK